VDFHSPLCRAADAAVEPVIESDRGPLVCRRRLGQGWVYYLGYTPGDGDAVQRLDAQVLAVIARDAGLRPSLYADFDTLVQRWTVPGGQIVAAWDALTMGRWSWRYQPGIAPLAYEAPGVRRRIVLPGAGRRLVYDFWRDQTEPIEGDATLTLRDALCGLWSVADDETALAGAKAARARLAAWFQPQ
jgi:hypothetical protein